MKLSPFEPRFLLESAVQGEHLGRYSLIGLGVQFTACLDESGFTVGDDVLPVPTGRDELLAQWRDVLSRIPSMEPSASGVPFSGGLVGATGYGLHHWFEDLGGRSSPGEAPLARFIVPRSVLIFDHMSRRAALLHSGGAVEREQLRKEVMATLASGLPSAAVVRPDAGAASLPLTASLDPEEFKRGVERIQRHIVDGDVYQAVLSVRFEGRSELDPFRVYRALRLINPSPYMYYLDLPGVKIVGSSPEALAQLDAGRAKLRPIAGTRPRGATEDEDRALEAELLADEKEAAEHVMLVDLARNDLGRVAAAGSVRVSPFRTIERYSHVMHLVSGVEGRLRPGRDALDLFAAAFPAGTVVGAPKIRAAEIIRGLEPCDRRFYAGSVGYFGASGSMDQAITIRTITFDGDRVALQAGAGIVADSDPELEYREVMAKSATLRTALALAGEAL